MIEGQPIRHVIERTVTNGLGFQPVSETYSGQQVGKVLRGVKNRLVWQIHLGMLELKTGGYDRNETRTLIQDVLTRVGLARSFEGSDSLEFGFSRSRFSEVVKFMDGSQEIIEDLDKFNGLLVGYKFWL